MSPQYALFLTLTALAIVLGIAAAQVVARLGTGPRSLLAHVIPVLAGFATMGALGHAMGAHFGPTIPLYGFQVSLLWDAAIGFGGGVVGAMAQLAVLRALRRRSPSA
jgi:uncharacterized membrane protein YoaK (UPF0700 family)